MDDKWPDNIPGKFYVTESCIDCQACQEAAPKNFVRQDEHGYSYVFKQPSTDEELEACDEALDLCPVLAIGKDL